MPLSKKVIFSNKTPVCLLTILLGLLSIPPSGFSQIRLTDRKAWVSELDAPSSPKRLRALDAVCAFQIREAIPMIRRTIQADPDPAVRGRASSTLAILGDLQAKPLLYAALRDTDRTVRLEAISALLLLADREDEMEFQRAASTETDPEVREALERAGQKVQEEASRVHSALTHLRVPDRNVRLQSVEILLQIPWRSAITLLSQYLTYEWDPWLRERACYALARTRSSDAQQALVIALKEDRALSVRRAAAFSLLSLGDSESIRQVREALDQKHLGDGRAFERIMELFSETTPSRRPPLRPDTAR